MWGVKILPTTMALTLSQMVSAVADNINQPITDDSRTITKTQAERDINIGYQKAVNSIIQIDEEYFQKLVTTDLISGQERYSLPADYKAVKRVELGYTSATDRVVADKVDVANDRYPATDNSTRAPTYYVMGSDYFLNPSPTTTVTNGIYLWYMYQPGNMTQTDDEPDLPLGYDHLPVLYATALAHSTLGNEPIRNNFMNEYMNDIESMKREIVGRRGGMNDQVVYVDMY